MSDWKALLKGDPTDWLLEGSNPSVRYFTLRWLFDLPEADTDVSAAAQAIGLSAPVQKLRSRQRPEGYWGSDDRPHHGTKRFLLLGDAVEEQGTEPGAGEDLLGDDRAAEHGAELEAGDGAAVSDESTLKLEARQETDFLLFDLP